MKTPIPILYNIILTILISTIIQEQQQQQQRHIMIEKEETRFDMITYTLNLIDSIFSIHSLNNHAILPL